MSFFRNRMANSRNMFEALNECLKVEGYKNARDMIEVALKKLEEE